MAGGTRTTRSRRGKRPRRDGPEEVRPENLRAADVSENTAEVEPFREEPETSSRETSGEGPSAAGPSGRALIEALHGIADPVVTREGYELVDLELASDRAGPIVRLYIDTVPPGDETRGVSIDDCSHVSRRVGEALDARDPVAGEYRLEVSSPGIFRPLTKPEHYDRAVGSRVKVRTHEKLDGRRVFIGTLRGRTEQVLELEVDGRPYEVPLSEVSRANLEPLFD